MGEGGWTGALETQETLEIWKTQNWAGPVVTGDLKVLFSEINPKHYTSPDLAHSQRRESGWGFHINLLAPLILPQGWASLQSCAPGQTCTEAVHGVVGLTGSFSATGSDSASVMSSAVDPLGRVKADWAQCCHCIPGMNQRLKHFSKHLLLLLL